MNEPLSLTGVIKIDFLLSTSDQRYVVPTVWRTRHLIVYRLRWKLIRLYQLDVTHMISFQPLVKDVQFSMENLASHLAQINAASTITISWLEEIVARGSGIKRLLPCCKKLKNWRLSLMKPVSVCMCVCMCVCVRACYRLARLSSFCLDIGYRTSIYDEYIIHGVNWSFAENFIQFVGKVFYPVWGSLSREWTVGTWDLRYRRWVSGWALSTYSSLF